MLNSILMRFTHDCEHCEFLGTYDDYDLWIHPSDRPINMTLIARYGDDGYQYSSVPVQLVERDLNYWFKYSPELVKAYQLARKKGIIPHA